MLSASIIVTVYNGAAYLRDQLDSLRLQSLEADEVLIFDDGSTDNSIRLIEEYIRQWDLKTWKLIQNAQNLGWRKNFIMGMDQASGDILFPCDQDDIWMKDKLEQMLHVFEEHENVQVLLGQAVYLLEDQPENQSLKQKISSQLDKRQARKNNWTGTLRQLAFNRHFKQIPQGCRMAVRKTFYDKIRPFWFEQLAHDRLLAYYGKIAGGFYLLDSPVIQYRLHAGSASVPVIRNRKTRLQELELDQKEINSLLTHAKECAFEPYVMEILAKARTWNQRRLALVRDRRFASGLLLIFDLPMYAQKRRLVTDWMYAFEKEKEST